ncbi:MAG: hypothetical protein ACR2OX_11675 [Methyloligellaceae bacterium]
MSISACGHLNLAAHGHFGYVESLLTQGTVKDDLGLPGLRDDGEPRNFDLAIDDRPGPLCRHTG